MRLRIIRRHFHHSLSRLRVAIASAESAAELPYRTTVHGRLLTMETSEHYGVYCSFGFESGGLNNVDRKCVGYNGEN